MGADLLADLKEQREKSGPCQVANYTLRGGVAFHRSYNRFCSRFYLFIFICTSCVGLR